MSARRKPSTQAEVLADLKAAREAYGPSKLPPERVYRHAGKRDPAPAPPPSPPSNGGPVMYATLNDELAEIGRACCDGEAWVTELYEPCAVHERQLRRWAAGRGTPTEACMGNARREFVRRYRKMKAAARRLGLDDEQEI